MRTRVTTTTTTYTIWSKWGMGRTEWHIKFDEEIEIERQKKHLGTEWNNWYTKIENEKEVLKEKKNE